MASNISESDVYETNIVGPDDGDGVNASSVRNGLQDLANRATNRKNRDDSFAWYLVNGTVGNGVDFALTQLTGSAPGYSVVSNRAEVPVAGKYLIIAALTVTSASTSNPKEIYVELQVGGSPFTSTYPTRYSANTSDKVTCCIMAIVDIATPASERISINQQSGANATAIESNMVIRRLS